jgi:hypothetical protein
LLCTTEAQFDKTKTTTNFIGSPYSQALYYNDLPTSLLRDDRDDGADENFNSSIYDTQNNNRIFFFGTQIKIYESYI